MVVFAVTAVTLVLMKSDELGVSHHLGLDQPLPSTVVAAATGGRGELSVSSLDDFRWDAIFPGALPQARESMALLRVECRALL